MVELRSFLERKAGGILVSLAAQTGGRWRFRKRAATRLRRMELCGMFPIFSQENVALSRVQNKLERVTTGRVSRQAGTIFARSNPMAHSGNGDSDREVPAKVSSSKNCPGLLRSAPTRIGPTLATVLQEERRVLQ